MSINITAILHNYNYQLMKHLSILRITFTGNPTLKTHIIIQSAKQRPDLKNATDELIYHNWPLFIQNSPVTYEHWNKLFKSDFSRFQQFAILQQGEKQRLIGVANSVPFPWEGDSLEQLPDNGWDEVFRRGMFARGKKVTKMLSALSVTVSPEFRGKNLPALLISSLKQAAIEEGLKGLVVPVRPTLKQNYPLQDFVQYCRWKNDNNEPFDPWIRTHWRLGAKIIQPAMHSMSINATLDKWQEWTGMKFLQSGQYIIPGGLVPLVVDVQQQMAYYIEPNLWMFHNLHA
ncbi:transferase [Photorhabdus laumondii]|uniref:transferase n=1 Tax=Photorhabdus laumondii TaxID=2218628 RepID=UPI001E548151|nr:transferase [Photorhabdus laumondii]